MRYYRAGTDIPIKLTFDIDGVLVVPDEGSITYTLYQNSGVPTAGVTNVSVTPAEGATSAVITVLAENNVLSDRLEKRSVDYVFTLNGDLHQKTISYFIMPRLNFTSTTKDVLNLIGVSDEEIQADEVNLITAYFQVEQDITQDLLEDSLADAAYLQMKAEKLIQCRAALNLMPSLQLRLAQSLSDGSNAYQRLKNIDLKAVESDLSSIYASLKSELSGQLETTPIFGSFVTRTDPITNA